MRKYTHTDMIRYADTGRLSNTSTSKETCIYTDAARTHAHTHTQTLCTQKPVHTVAFTHRSVYTQKLFHTDTFTHRSFDRRFYTQKL